MIQLSTVALLREWARWGETHNISYPTMSPMFGERALKMPLFGSNEAPPDVFKIELCVCLLPFGSRDIIIQRYQRHLTFVKMGQRIGISRWAAKARLRKAEDEVHHEFSKNPCSYAPTSVTFATHSRTAP